MKKVEMFREILEMGKQAEDYLIKQMTYKEIKSHYNEMKKSFEEEIGKKFVFSEEDEYE